MFLTTTTHRLFVARAAATEDTLLDLTTKGDFANKPVTALDLRTKDIITPNPLPMSAELRPNGLRFMFCGSANADENFLWYLKTWGNENWPCHYVATGTGKLGTQAVVKYPHNGVAVANMFWADTLTVTWYNWLKGIVSTDEIGHNSVSEIWLDCGGSRYWLPEIRTTEASATAATTIAIYYGYW